MIKGGSPSSWGKLLELPEKKEWFGLGYQPTVKEASKTDQKRVCTIQETFHNVGFSYEGQMAMLGEIRKEVPNLVCHCLPYTILNNWKTVEILEMFSFSK